MMINAISCLVRAFPCAAQCYFKHNDSIKLGAILLSQNHSIGCLLHEQALNLSSFTPSVVGFYMCNRYYRRLRHEPQPPECTHIQEVVVHILLHWKWHWSRMQRENISHTRPLLTHTLQLGGGWQKSDKVKMETFLIGFFKEPDSLLLSAAPPLGVITAEVFMQDALPDATLPIYQGLGPALGAHWLVHSLVAGL